MKPDLPKIRNSLVTRESHRSDSFVLQGFDYFGALIIYTTMRATVLFLHQYSHN